MCVRKGVWGEGRVYVLSGRKPVRDVWEDACDGAGDLLPVDVAGCGAALVDIGDVTGNRLRAVPLRGADAVKYVSNEMHRIEEG